MKDCECHSHKEDSHGKFPRIPHLLSFFLFLFFLNYLFSKTYIRNTTKVSNSLYSRSVESDLGPNCLKRLSADVTIGIRVKCWRVVLHIYWSCACKGLSPFLPHLISII